MFVFIGEAVMTTSLLLNQPESFHEQMINNRASSMLSQSQQSIFSNNGSLFNLPQQETGMFLPQPNMTLCWCLHMNIERWSNLCGWTHSTWMLDHMLDVWYASVRIWSINIWNQTFINPMSYSCGEFMLTVAFCEVGVCMHTASVIYFLFYFYIMLILIKNANRTETSS